MKKLIIFTGLVLLLSTSASLAQKTIRILSYNVLYGLQKDSVNINRYKQLIADLDPDIVANQEMNDFTQESLEALANSYGHPYALQSKEEGFPVALSSKRPMVNFKKVTENMWHAYIYAKVDGLHLFVIHFSPFDYKKRQEEVTNIIAQTRELPADEPILIMGDFNSLSGADKANYSPEMLEPMRRAEEEHEHIRNLNQGAIDYTVIDKLSKAGFIDTYLLTGNTFKGSAPTLKDGKGNIKTSNTGSPKRIDYIWCNKAAAKFVRKSDIIQNELTHYISDHYPMFIELELD